MAPVAADVMENPYSVIVIAHQQQRQFHEFKRKYIAGAVYWLPNLASWAVLYAARITRGLTHWTVH